MSHSQVSSVPPTALVPESRWRRLRTTTAASVGSRVVPRLRRTQQQTMTDPVLCVPAIPMLQEHATLRTLLRFFHHELQSAVTGLRAYLALTTADGADDVADALAATVTKMHDLSQRMVVLSCDGQTALRREEVDLRSIVESEVAQLRVQGAHLHVTTELPAAPVVVWADATLLGMAVGTALRNAAEAYDPLTAMAPIVIHLRVTATAVAVGIDDQGPGFPVDLLTTIAAARPVLGWTTKAHGSGTGISLIRGVAQLHGGQATFCNRPEGGASVMLTLPLVVSPTDGALPNAVAAEPLL